MEKVKNSSNVNPWAGYEITKVRIFRYSVIAQQTNEGRPWKLKTDMEFAEETPQLMLAIKTGIDATPSMNGKVPRHTTYLRTTEREKKRASRVAMREIVKHYQGSDKEGNINYICCQSKCCVEGFGCSLLNAGEARCSYDIFQWIRGKYHQMSRLQQRAFIANRLINRCATSMANTKKFYFEKVEILQGYMHNCHLPSMPAIGDPSEKIRVCRSFFLWAIGCSKNKVDQSTKRHGMFGPDFSVEMSGPREPCMWDAGAADCIVLWLLAFSSFHLHDPAHPQIILSVASLSQVYDCYAADFLLPGKKNISRTIAMVSCIYPLDRIFWQLENTPSSGTHKSTKISFVFNVRQVRVFCRQAKSESNSSRKAKKIKRRARALYVRKSGAAGILREKEARYLFL